MPRVLIAGVSTRGFAESAARAGYEVVAVDGYGDLDLVARAAVVRVVRVRGRFSTRAAVAAARGLECDAVVYEASFENHPRAVRALAGPRPLWGNGPAVLAWARDPRRLARVAGHDVEMIEHRAAGRADGHCLDELAVPAAREPVRDERRPLGALLCHAREALEQVGGRQRSEPLTDRMLHHLDVGESSREHELLG